MGTFKKLSILVLALLPIIYSWLVQLRISPFIGWTKLQYIAVFIILSFLAFWLFQQDKENEIFNKYYGNMLIINSLVFIALNWVYGIIGPNTHWIAVWLGIWYIFLALFGAWLCIISDNSPSANYGE